MNKGIEPFCRAAADWLGRRFALPRAGGPRHRGAGAQRLARGAFPRRAWRPRNWVSGRAGRPAILMPNPFYAAYAAGAVAADCEPVYLPATRRAGFLPDLDALSDSLLARTVAFYIASPANPQGAVADPGLSRPARRRLRGASASWSSATSAIRKSTRTHAPAGMLEAAGPDFANVVVFQSLSKRSNLPGLRVGFAAGDRGFPGPLPRSAQRRGPAGAGAGAAGGHRGLCGRSPRRGQPPPLQRRNSISPIRSSATATAIGARPAASFSGSTSRRRAATKPPRCGCGGEAGLRVVPGRYLAQPTSRRQQSGRRLHPRRHGAGQRHHRGGAASPRRGARLRAELMPAVERSFDSLCASCPTACATLRAPAPARARAASR